MHDYSWQLQVHIDVSTSWYSRVYSGHQRLTLVEVTAQADINDLNKYEIDLTLYRFAVRVSGPNKNRTYNGPALLGLEAHEEETKGIRGLEEGQKRQHAP
jgi:hypothetical protein